MPEMEPKERDTQSLQPRHCPRSKQYLASQQSPQPGQLKLPQPIYSSGSQSAIHCAFALMGQINSEALGRHMSNEIKAEVMQSRPALPNEVTSGLAQI